MEINFYFYSYPKNHRIIYFIPGAHICFLIWIGLHVVIIGLILPVTRCFVSSGFKGRAAYLTLMSLTLVLMFSVPFVLVFYYQIYHLSCGVILVEQVRLLMKMISFVVENVKKQVEDKNGNREPEKGNEDSENNSHPDIVVPTLKSLLYFLVAPTLIYRDAYPASKQGRDLTNAGVHVLQGIVHINAIGMMVKYTATKFSRIGIEPIPKTDLVDGIFASCVCSLMFQIGLHFGLFHQYENAWSEILDFGDRQFYGPWWREKDLGKKIRFMNMIVSDFLFEYVYRPVRFLGGSRLIASYAVVAVSGIFHEYIMWISLRFLFPVMTVSMIVSIIVTHVGDKVIRGGDRSLAMFVHYCAFVSVNSLIAISYMVEYYSRVNCPSESTSVIDYFTPRMLSCVIFQ